MSKTLVVSQPMFLPWVGLFEQIRLADIFVHYDDVQLPQGRSFMSRVQVKTHRGTQWLTAPIDRQRSGRLLNEVYFTSDRAWRHKHLNTLRHAYTRTRCHKAMLQLAEKLYANETNRLDNFNAQTIEQIADYLEIDTPFFRSSETGVGGSSTQRLVDLCKHFDADVYATGHGAANYIDHQAFEDEGIQVKYMDYQRLPYTQPHNGFTPYVTILDAISCCGEDTRDLIQSEAVYWKDCKIFQSDK